MSSPTELLSTRCLSCGHSLEQELTAAQLKIHELESIIRRMELQRSFGSAKCTEAPRDGRGLDAPPNLQVITTRIDDPQARSPYSCSSLTPCGAPPPIVHDGAEESDNSSESTTPVVVAGNSRRTSVFAALPAEGARRRSVQVTPRGTAADGPDSFDWSAMAKDSPPNRFRPTSSITFAVPSEHQVGGWEPVVPVVSPVELPPPPQPSQPIGEVNNNMALNDAAADSASCAAPVEWTLVSEKEVGDKGSQCTITIRANAATQTPPFEIASRGSSGSVMPNTLVTPTPPRNTTKDKDDEHKPSPFARQLLIDNASHALDVCVGPSPNTENRDPMLPRVRSFPANGHASLYEARRANKISSIASSGAQRNH